MSSEPEFDIPAYVRDGIRRQDLATLEEIRRLVDELVEERQTLDEETRRRIEEAAENVDQSTLDELESGDGSIVTKRVPCGKDCKTCREKGGHGPYRYRVVYRDGSADWEYLGPVSDDGDDGDES